MPSLNTPQISVITPVFNGAEYIAETIESVLEFGNRFNIEYLVVNDGSTDGTESVLDGFLGRIRVINQVNMGESAAVNAGITAAVGSYLLIVSADDPIFTEKIFEPVTEFFEKNPGVAAWYPDWRIIDSKGDIVSIVELPEYSDELLIGRFKCLPGPGTFFRRDWALEIHGRNTNRIFTGDYDFWLRLSKKGEIRHREGVLAQWRSHPASTSISKRGDEMAKERIAVICDQIHLLTDNPKLVRVAKAHAYYNAALLSYFSKKVPGKKYLLKAFLIRRGWVAEAKLRVIFYILLLPFSRLEKVILRRAR